MSLDYASVSLQDCTGRVERVDLPMRAFAGGYYKNLKAMYDYIGVQYHPQKFLFAFSQTESSIISGTTVPYFIHASNNHVLPPIRPRGASLLHYVVEVAFVTICYLWLTVCCFLVEPLESEDYAAYLSRIRLPWYFVTSYILPLLCSVATCTPQALLAFPARDIVDYRKLSHGAEHFVVSNGVHTVQDKLSEGLDLRFCAQVARVEPNESGVKISWESCSADNEKNGEIRAEYFDRVVLAVTPDVVAKIFSPLQQLMGRIPTITVESVVLQPYEKSWRLSMADERESHTKERSGTPPRSNRAQLITLRSRLGTGQGSELTEAIHELDNGSRVATCAFSSFDDREVLHRSRFTRVLRSVESRNLLQKILDDRERAQCQMLVDGEKQSKLDGGISWHNGDGNVWLAGGWCWDGMVLLEGCVVSAMRVAQDFEVDVPWSQYEE